MVNKHCRLFHCFVQICVDEILVDCSLQLIFNGILKALDRKIRVYEAVMTALDEKLRKTSDRGVICEYDAERELEKIVAAIDAAVAIMMGVLLHNWRIKVACRCENLHATRYKAFDALEGLFLLVQTCKWRHLFSRLAIFCSSHLHSIDASNSAQQAPQRRSQESHQGLVPSRTSLKWRKNPPRRRERR